MKKVITYDELLDVIPNKYILTIVAGKRSRDIGKGAPLMVKCGKKDTSVKKTFKEIVEHKLSYKFQEENE
ncbi:DNA-directed RNA polymerase subunit omega [Cetobacterium sp. SF1]|uniref:DNA-directed RNA polymerase subunit omega n=1 Tax=Cetobacterium sp. SF1 TaxID=3417654 RepID=UPI003CF42B41